MELPPGFRFHPTDEELITHYLARKAADPRFAPLAVGVADLNKCEPWDLPCRAAAAATGGNSEAYFFCVKDRKYPTGLRTNRATESGYWKATGKDREILRGKALVGMKKTLVFYTGRAPRGGKTGWVMHEYRLHGIPSSAALRAAGGASKDEWVLCRVFKKSIEAAPSVVAGGSSMQRSPSVACMGMEEDVAGGVGPPSSAMSMSMADDFAAACALPPLMDVSGGGGSGASMSLSAAPAAHVTCFSNALEGQFLNPAPCPAASASPFLPASMMQQAQYDGGDAGGMVRELLEEAGAGGWYGSSSSSKLPAGERERLSGGGGGASQDTGVTSEVNLNPAEISSATRHHMDHEASFWGFLNS